MVPATSEPKPTVCRRCGAPLSAHELAGNCPRCLSARLFAADGSPSPVTTSPEPLRRIGGYELMEEVARGGMGVVYRARQADLDRLVAVKLLRDSLLAQPEDVKRFRAEAAAAGRLRHPNIVAIHKVGEEQGQHFMAMDLVAGPNLAQLIRADLLEPRRAAELVAQIADAVQHAHAQGILHRDLKPSNVLVDGEGTPFVTDFGLARTLDTSSTLTLTGQVVGTPAYMSPEQASGLSEAVGPASDVYSLGALLFHLLTARPPFVSNSVPELLRQVATDEPLSPQLLNASVPLDLATVCLKCLAKRPADRYGSAREFEEDLRRFLQHEPVTARPIGSLEKLARWGRREPALAGALGFAVLGLVLGGGIATWQWRRAEKEAIAAKEELWHAQLLEARSYRLDGGFGQRTKTLETVAKAASYRPSVELRNEAIATLVLPDIGTNIWWHTEDNPAAPSAFTGNLEFYFRLNATGHVTVCQASNQQLVAEFDGPATNTRYAQFSPDSRWLAVQFRDGAVRVWDWRARQLALEAICSKGSISLPAFDFSPDSLEIWLVNGKSHLEHFALPEGRPLPVSAPSVTADGIRLDRAGRQLLAFEDKMVSAWNLTTGRRLGLWQLPKEVWRVVWHPHGREFAVGTYGAGVFVGEVGRTNLDLLEAPDQSTAPTSMTFTPEGSLLLVGGWGNLFAAWDFATRKVALWSRLLWFGQLSDDGARVSLLDENRGFGVRQFLNPVGIRRLRVPSNLSGGVCAADWLPGGTRLAIGHVGEPRSLLPENSGANERAALSPDGTRFAAVGPTGGFVGSLADGSDLHAISQGAADTVTFSPDGRWLRLASHHDPIIHIRLAADGTMVTNLQTRSGAALFVPGGKELLAMGQSTFSYWQLGTWQRLRELPYGEGSEGFVGFAPDGSYALANGRDLMLRLWDLEANREIACLRLPEGSAAWECVFDPSGRFIATTSSYSYLRVWDFPALRHELRELGLDWPDAHPVKGFHGLDDRVRER
ncbi:MAG: WD40 repeat domain-containing serine/threonine protein kinase [Verrucomicrobiota bacterium]